MRGTTTGSRLLGSLLLAALLILLALPARAQEPGRAGLVVQFDESRVETRCLEVAGEGVKGVELLQGSGLDVVADLSGGMGVSVCRLEGQGCDFPGQHCFCQCMGGGECTYWNYFYREPGAETWTYSPLGAGLHTVLPGSVEAWVWGDGRTPPADDLTFEAICEAPTPEVVAAATGTATPLPTGEASPSPAAAGGQPSPAVTPSPPASATTGAAGETPAGAEATAATTPDSAADEAATAGGYLAFGAMLLLLAAVGIVVWLRRR